MFATNSTSRAPLQKHIRKFILVSSRILYHKKPFIHGHYHKRSTSGAGRSGESEPAARIPFITELNLTVTATWVCVRALKVSA